MGPNLEDYHFDATRLQEAQNTCFRQFVEMIQKNKPLVIVDNTNITAAEYAPYMMFAAAYGYHAKMLTILVPLEVGIQRNVHRVPANTVLAMYRGIMEERVPPYFDHEVVLGKIGDI
jgi:predicted kinase